MQTHNLKYPFLMAFAVLCFTTTHAATTPPNPFCSFLPWLSPTRTVLLQEGEPIFLELVSDIDVDNIEINNTINFRVSSNVMVEGKEAIRAHTTAVGVVSRIERSTTNTTAKVQINVCHIRAVDGQQVLVDGPTNLTLTNQGANVTVYVKNEVNIKL